MLNYLILRVWKAKFFNEHFLKNVNLRSINKYLRLTNNIYKSGLNK